MLFNDPIVGKLLGPILARVIGVQPRVIRRLYTDEEKRRSDAMSLEELVEDTLQVKYSLS
ncbi:MAG: hypothetical protein M5U28_35835 [Sandaracinaceae bacterium]|nr:hypothetical protein [Sandaracinaceae bacterium]